MTGGSGRRGRVGGAAWARICSRTLGRGSIRSGSPPYVVFGSNSENAHAVFIDGAFELECRWFHLYPNNAAEHLSETLDCANAKRPELVLVTVGFFEPRGGGPAWDELRVGRARLPRVGYVKVADQDMFQVWRRGRRRDSARCAIRNRSGRRVLSAVRRPSSTGAGPVTPNRHRPLPRVRAGAGRRRTPVPSSACAGARGPRARRRAQPDLGRTRACLFNSFNFDFARVRRFARRDCRMVHRVDGPIGAYRGFDDGTDARIVRSTSSSRPRRSCSPATASRSTESWPQAP